MFVMEGRDRRVEGSHLRTKRISKLTYPHSRPAAGCNALGFGSETTPTPTTETTTTTTETTTTTTETTTTTIRNATSYPPGIAENGTVMDASALANAHHQILLDEGAIWHTNRTSTQSVNVSYEQHISTGVIPFTGCEM